MRVQRKRTGSFPRAVFGGVLVLGAALAAAGENLVRNGGFDAPAAGKKPVWSPRDPAAVSYVFHKDGPKNRFLVISSKKASAIPLVLQTNLPLRGGEDYTVAYDVRAAKGVSYRVYVEWWKAAGGFGGGRNPGWRKGTGFWEHESFRLHFPAAMKPPYIVLQLRAPGAVAYDNVRIDQPVPEPVRAGCVFSADFESGPGTWELPRETRIETGDTPSGKAYLAIGSRAKGHDPAAVVRGIPTRPGRRYRLTYRVRAGGGSTEVTGYQFYRVTTGWDRLIKDGRDFGSVSQHDGLAWRDCYRAWQRRTLEFTAPGKPTGGLTLTCQVRGPGTVQLDDMELREIPGGELEAPLDIDITAPPYRALVFPGEGGGAIRGRVRVMASGPARVEIRLEGGKAKVTKILKTKGEDALPPPVSFSFPAETGTVIAEAFGPAGKSLGTTRVTVARAAPPAPGAHTVRICADGIFLQDDQTPIFPVGLWRMPATERALAELAEAGFNVVRCSADPKALAKLEQYGMFGMASVSPYLPPGADQRTAWEKKIREIMRPLWPSPALLGYYLVDEPLWSGRPLKPLLDAYRFYRREDPYHPVWMNMAPRGTVMDLGRYNRACDITGVDIYPVPEGGSHSEMEDKTLACVGRYTEKMRRAVGGRKPVWMTLQGFAWKHLSSGRVPGAVYPDRHQSRFMAWDAILHGAGGIMYWGTHTIALADFWDVLFDTSRDLHAASGFLVWETVGGFAGAPGDAKALVSLHKRDPDVLDRLDRDTARNVVVVGNESASPVTATLRLPFGGTAIRAYDGPLGQAKPRAVALQGGVCRESFGPYEVRVYADGPLPSPPRPLPAGLAAKYPESDSLKLSARFRRDSVPYAGKASWIWFPGTWKQPNSQCMLRCRFRLAGKIRSAELLATADDDFSLRINGREAAADNGWSRMRRRDVRAFLRPGENVILVSASDGGQPPCGFLADLRVVLADGSTSAIRSDASWQAASWDGKPVASGALVKRAWRPAEVLAPYGSGPWGARVVILPAD